MAAQLELIAVSKASTPPVGWTEHNNRLISLEIASQLTLSIAGDQILTHAGLSQCRARNLTPPPQVLEQLPYGLHVPQPPSCLSMSAVTFMQ